MLSPQPRDHRIEISMGPNGLKRTYSAEGIRTATVYPLAGRWWVRCYFGPDDSDSVRSECGTAASGETIAIRHTLRLVECRA
jgi:hypothetical protein